MSTNRSHHQKFIIFHDVWTSGRSRHEKVIPIEIIIFFNLRWGFVAVMRSRPITHRIELDSDTYFLLIIQRNRNVMWVDQSDGLIWDQLMVESIEWIFFLSGRSRETWLTPKLPINIESGEGRRCKLSSESSFGYTNTMRTQFPFFDHILHVESTFLLFQNQFFRFFDPCTLSNLQYVWIHEKTCYHTLTPVQSLWTSNMIRLSSSTLF